MDAPALPLVRRLRIAGIALVVAWFLVPGLRDWIPVWVPFLAFAALELNYLVGGLRDRGSPRRTRGRSPQESDISELRRRGVARAGARPHRGPRRLASRGGPKRRGGARADRGEPRAAAARRAGARARAAPRAARGPWRGAAAARPARRARRGRRTRVRPLRAAAGPRLGRARRERAGADRGAALGRGGPDRRARGRVRCDAEGRAVGSSSTPTAWPRSAAPAPS